MRINKIFNIKNGYTMAEMLIVIGIIGFIASLVLPTLNASIPRKYEALHKKGDYALEHIVAAVVENEEYYETRHEVDNETHTISYFHGLQSTFPVIVNGQVMGDSDPNSLAAEQKFCRLFASKFNLKDGTGLNCSKDAGFTMEGKTPTFTSIDGIEWVVPVSNFRALDENGNFKNEIIMYKSSENDDSRAPQCAYISEEKYSFIIPEDKVLPFVETEKSRCARPDIFIYAITPSGKLFKEEATSDEVRRR